MPVVKVYGLPSKLANDNEGKFVLTALIVKIREAVAGVKELGIDDDQVSVFCIPSFGGVELGEEIIVEITGLFKKPERTHGVLQRVAEAVAGVVRDRISPILPRFRMVEVFLFPFDTEANGFAAWNKPEETD
ncbi:MAG: hypothetical protein V1664_02180 [Candidatus Uhrbacteria bacterium]